MKPNPDKEKFLFVALACAMLALALCLGFSGCATGGWQQTTAKSLATTVKTVDAAMKGWAIWVAQGKATDADEVFVRSLYEKYQSAEQIAEQAYYLAVTSQDQSLLTDSQAGLAAAKTGILAAIAARQQPTATKGKP